MRHTTDSGGRRRVRTGRRRLRWLTVLALALLPAAAGCAGEDPLAPEWRELERAERLWSDAGPATYEYVYTPSCFCPYTPRRVTVRDGEVVSVEIIQPDAPVPVPQLEGYTVEQLLERVREELRRNPYRARLEFDSTLGYPLDVWFDYEENAIDEEWGFSVTELQPIE